MIIIGYQGIGKSTLAAQDITCIDLESGNFWYNVNGKQLRDDMWYVPYCNIAESLSAQGYDVLVSSHSAVRRQLAHTPEHVVAVVPALNLKDKWIDKLRDRYEYTHKDKDLKALLNAEELYTTNIEDIKLSCPNVIEITHMNYQLGLMIHDYHRQLKEDM